MELRKTIRIRLLISAITEIDNIARVEGRDTADVARALIKSGIRSYKRGRPLLCGYPNCTRKDCCGKSIKGGLVVDFPLRERQL
jgi:hypothetical protein